MIPYVILLLFVLCGLLLKENNLDVRIYSISLIDNVILIIFILFYSLRYEIGYDYSSYESLIINGWYDAMLESKIEYFSYWILDFAHTYNEPQMFFVITALISLPLYFYSFYKYKCIKNSFLWGLLLFLAMPIGFLYSLSISRQFIASSVILFSTKYLINRSFGKFAACICLASLFHMTSLIYLGLYLATYKQINIRNLSVAGSGVLFLSSFLRLIIDKFFPVYLAYIETNNDASGLPQVILYTLMGMFFLIFQDKFKYNIFYILYLKLYLLGLIMCYSFIAIDPTIGIRLGLSGLIFACFLFPYIIFNAFKLYYRFIICSLYVVFVTFMYLYGLSTGGGSYIPYKTILSLL